MLVQTYLCPASQNDVSVYKNLLFMSSESTNSRSDCGFGGVPDPVSKTRVRGIRVFDIANVAHPKLVTSVQTCRGSHTHTLVTQPGDNDNVYIYVSGTAGVRSAEELPGCQEGPIDNPNTARFRLEVIKVPGAGCARFWIEFALGKFLFPEIQGDNLELLNPAIAGEAEQIFGAEFVQGCHWG